MWLCATSDFTKLPIDFFNLNASQITFTLLQHSVNLVVNAVQF